LGTDRFEGIHCVVKKDDYNYVLGANSNYASHDVTCDLFPNNIIDENAWLFEIKDCSYYMPLSPNIIIGPDTVCSTVNPESLYFIETVPWAKGYDWIIEPDSAGIFFLDSASIHANWNPLFEGMVTVKARSYNDCGYSDWSEPYFTQVYSCLGVSEQGGWEAGKRGSVVLWPNPASGVLGVKCSGLSAGISYSIIIYDIYGREVRKIPVPGPGSNIQFSVENFAPGLYLVVLKDWNDILGSAKLVVAR
jgi:hypothetical protein